MKVKKNDIRFPLLLKPGDVIEIKELENPEEVKQKLDEAFEELMKEFWWYERQQS